MVFTLAAAVVGCGGPGPQLTTHSAVIPRELAGPCPTAGAGGVEFLEEVTALEVVISGADIEAPISATGDVSGVTLEEVPAGVDRTVAVYGSPATGPATWRGGARGVEVQADTQNPVEVLLTRIADLSCPRTGMTDKRAFSTATLLKDGRVLLVGGANGDVDAIATCGSGCRRLSATGTAEIYDPATGTFTAAGSLSAPRMMHTAALMDDGRVVIAGGAGEALVVSPDATNPFPIKPVLPVATIEVFDPTNLGFTPSGNDPGGPRVFAASATSKGGQVVITGGIPAAGAPKNDLSNALATSTVCSGAPLACSAGPALARRRAGHTAVTLSPQDGARAGVYLWGGSVDEAAVGGVAGWQIEALKDGAAGFALVDVAAMAPARNLFFAATSRYLAYRVLSAGGLVRAADGTFSVASVDVDGVAKGPVYVFDASAVAAGGIATGAEGAPMGTSLPVWLAGAAALPGASRAIVAGGFGSLDLVPADGLALYDESTLTISALSVGGAPRLLRQPRGALVLAGLGDGTVLVAGGETPIAGGGRSPLDTAEIFTDPVDPFGGAP